ncbi:MAG: hypothetical protein J6T70_01475 [Bacteroidales bacterium]|nr:hypothetical protein [Bacteroidales bacterium]
MKRILFTVLLLCFGDVSVFAQEGKVLSPLMSAFKDYCIHAANAAGTDDKDELMRCIDGWEQAEFDDNGNVVKPEKFVYDGQPIVYSRFGFLQLRDTVQQVADVSSHFEFVPAKVDSILTNNYEPILLADAAMLRIGKKTCEYAVNALQPHGSVFYETRGTGDMEMFVVAEYGGQINFAIHSVEKDFMGAITNETILSDNGGNQSAQLIWTVSRNGTIYFSIENLTDKEISFIVVKKM